jgi:death-on-curing protein
MSSKLNYLTVPDFLWINLQLTKENQVYAYAKLEEAVFYQYAYGRSFDLAGQAARLLIGFHRMRPFVLGNDATTLVGVIGFLRMNDHSLNLNPSDAAHWMREIWEHPERAREDIESKLEHIHGHDRHGVPDTKGILQGILAEYAGAATVLGLEETPVPLAMISNSRLTGEHA